MKKQIFSFDELQEIGFTELSGDSLDDGGYYRWWRYSVNDVELDITYEFNSDGIFCGGTVDLCSVELHKDVSRENIKLLLFLLKNPKIK